MMRVRLLQRHVITFRAEEKWRMPFESFSISNISLQHYKYVDVDNLPNDTFKNSESVELAITIHYIIDTSNPIIPVHA